MTTTVPGIDPAWVRAQVTLYSQVYPSYQLFADTLQKVLSAASRQYASLAIVQTRPKSISSFSEKIQRKWPKYKDPIHQLTDLCGGRVIADLHSEVEAISRFIEAHFEIDWANSVDVSQRLKPSEFGYRSIHYIVQFKPGVFPTEGVTVEIPAQVIGLKAEIQVRTLLEHAWANFAHDRSYKSGFPLPVMLQRQLSAYAAMLEEVGSGFSQIQDNLKTYSAGFGSYLTEDQLREEIKLLQIVLGYDPKNHSIANRLGKLLICLGDWQQAVEVLSPYAETGYRPLLKDLGLAFCKLYAGHRDGPNYHLGQKYLESACEDEQDAEALVYLADSWKGLDRVKEQSFLHQAFTKDPTNSFVLDRYLTSEIVQQGSLHMVALATPVIESAILKDRVQADAGIDLPWAFYNMGKFYLLMNRPGDSLIAYAKAIELSTHVWMIEDALKAVENLACVQGQLVGYGALKALLLLGLACKSRNPTVQKALQEIASPGSPEISPPVVIVLGACEDDGKEIQNQQAAILAELAGFKGTLLCEEGLHTETGYHQPVWGACEACGAVQTWVDLVAAGIYPEDVKVVSIGFSSQAALACRVALGLGAQVGILENSGKEGVQILSDEDWKDSARLFCLPPDAEIVAAFAGPGCPQLNPDMREIMAVGIHDGYREFRRNNLPDDDPVMADWTRLNENLKASNRQQADHIFAKLEHLGLKVRMQDSPVACFQFSPPEIEFLAEMEHARWTAERILQGWKIGPKRDPDKKINPYLVAWVDLPEDARELNRQAVRRISAVLAKTGLEIYR